MLICSELKCFLKTFKLGKFKCLSLVCNIKRLLRKVIIKLQLNFLASDTNKINSFQIAIEIVPNQFLLSAKVFQAYFSIFVFAY